MTAKEFLRDYYAGFLDEFTDQELADIIQAMEEYNQLKDK